MNTTLYNLTAINVLRLLPSVYSIVSTIQYYNTHPYALQIGFKALIVLKCTYSTCVGKASNVGWLQINHRVILHAQKNNTNCTININQRLVSALPYNYTNMLIRHKSWNVLSKHVVVNYATTMH